MRCDRRGTLAATIVVAALLSLGTGDVHAAGVATINVTANIQGQCQFTSAATSLDFGSLMPGGSDISRNTTIQFWCVKGLVFGGSEGFSVVGGLGPTNMRQLSGTGGNPDLIDFSIDALTPDTNPNQGASVPRTLTIVGTIYANTTNGYNKASVDAAGYAATVTLNVTP